MIHRSVPVNQTQEQQSALNISALVCFITRHRWPVWVDII